jgi:hypothetical protein
MKAMAQASFSTYGLSFSLQSSTSSLTLSLAWPSPYGQLRCPAALTRHIRVARPLGELRSSKIVPDNFVPAQ